MRIVFLGDSITDANHNWNVDPFGLGDGYVSIVAQALRERGEDVTILNRGHDGFTKQGVRRTLIRDCLLRKPDIVSILIGCNDVGVMMNTGRTLEEQEFEAEFEAVINIIREETDAQIICMTPFIFPHPQEYENWIPGIKKAEKCIKTVVDKYSLQCICLHDYLQEQAKQYGYSELTTDGIHLTRKGAKLVAEKWLQVYNTSSLTNCSKSDTITDK